MDSNHVCTIINRTEKTIPPTAQIITASFVLFYDAVSLPYGCSYLDEQVVLRDSIHPNTLVASLLLVVLFLLFFSKHITFFFNNKINPALLVAHMIVFILVKIVRSLTIFIMS